MENRPRKRWIAGLLSLVQPGLGQIYNGQLRKAIVIYILPLLLIPIMILCLNVRLVKVCLPALVILAVTYYLWAIIDAIRTAGKLSSEYYPKRYNMLITYVGIYLLGMVIFSITSGGIRSHFIQAFTIPASSMEPTILVGDRILVDRREQARNPRRGDLIVFEYPGDVSKYFMKRVVAIGGDTVEIRDKQLIVNGNPMKEPYVIYGDRDVLPAGQSPRDNLGSFIIPADNCFVLGDNRDRSLDSRFFGVVHKSRIKGTVKSIYWSWDGKKGSVRWERIGRDVLQPNRYVQPTADKTGSG
ncbi:MAG: Signal peptidase I P [Syntrophorhabdus sp. PtaU1.Bin058]|nr:MAG: Signal peptidase I P [Syntrophorhabdus sp. PtaU1.Bin058]